MISGNREADLTAVGGGDATVNSADGEVNLFSGGPLSVNAEAQTGIQAGSNGTLSINGTISTGDIVVVSVDNSSGSLTATTGPVTALSVAGENAMVYAGNDATVFGGTGLGGGVNAFLRQIARLPAPIPPRRQY